MSRDPAAALKRRLESLPDQLHREVASALQDIGDAMVAEAQQRLATDEAGRDPGPASRDPAAGVAAALVAKLDEDGSRVTVMAEGPAARALEYGTRRMPARPFLRPAGDALRPTALARCRAALARAAKTALEPR